MNYQKLSKKLTSGEIPTDAMGAGGVLVLLLAMKAARPRSTRTKKNLMKPLVAFPSTTLN